MQDAQGLADLPGEDSARFTIAGIVHATGRYTVATSQRPSNWPMNAKQRVDLALRGINQGAEGWYGAIEVRPGSRTGVDFVLWRRRPTRAAGASINRGLVAGALRRRPIFSGPRPAFG